MRVEKLEMGKIFFLLSSFFLLPSSFFLKRFLSVVEGPSAFNKLFGELPSEKEYSSAKP